MKKVLFVCTGNTCRSPMAEALLKHKASDQFDVQSAGVFAETGQSAHPNAITVLNQRGVAIDHKSQALTDELVQWADHIFTMTQGHKRALLQQYPHALEKTATLKEFVSEAEVWEAWIKVKADFETKLANYEREQGKLTAEEQQERETELQKISEKIYALELRMNSLDIMDPFGAPEEVYHDVCQELETLIDQMINKA